MAERARADDFRDGTRWIALVIAMLFMVEGLALLVNVAWPQ